MFEKLRGSEFFLGSTLTKFVVLTILSSLVSDIDQRALVQSFRDVFPVVRIYTTTVRVIRYSLHCNKDTRYRVYVGIALPDANIYAELT